MNILRRMVGLFLLLVAIVCFGYPHYMDWKMGQKAENMTQQVQEQVQQEVIPEANVLPLIFFPRHLGLSSLV